MAACPRENLEGINKLLIKRRLRKAHLKSALFSAVSLIIIFNIFCFNALWQVGFIPVFIFCFVFCHNIVFLLWFGRGLPQETNYSWSHGEFEQQIIDDINTANGYGPGFHAIMPLSDKKY